MKINIEVNKNQNETNPSLLRRFSRRVQESGNINTVKGKRYNTRSKSKLSNKKSALVKLKRRAEKERLKKLGKLS